jgi:hypothetical protein
MRARIAVVGGDWGAGLEGDELGNVGARVEHVCETAKGSRTWPWMRGWRRGYQCSAWSLEDRRRGPIWRGMALRSVEQGGGRACASSRSAAAKTHWRQGFHDAGSGMAAQRTRIANRRSN